MKIPSHLRDPDFEKEIVEFGSQVAATCNSPEFVDWCLSQDNAGKYNLLGMITPEGQVAIVCAYPEVPFATEKVEPFEPEPGLLQFIEKAKQTEPGAAFFRYQTSDAFKQSRLVNLLKSENFQANRGNNLGMQAYAEQLIEQVRQAVHNAAPKLTTTPVKVEFD